MSNAFNDHVMSEKFIQLCEDVATMKSDIKEVAAMKIIVERHDRIYQYGKWTAVPVIALLHLGVKHLLQKIGW